MFDNLYQRFGKNTVYVALACILIVLNILSLIMAYQFRITFSIDGEKFKYVSYENNEMTFKDAQGNVVLLTSESPLIYRTSFLSVSKFKVEYKDKIITCDNSNPLSKGCVMTLSDGKQYIQEVFKIITDNEEIDKILPFDVQLVNNIQNVFNFIMGESLVEVPFYTIPFALVGLFSMMYSEKMWEIQHFFDVKGGEPTDWAIVSNKIFGLLMLASVFIIPITIIFN